MHKVEKARYIEPGNCRGWEIEKEAMDTKLRHG
jgi:hypothetical protein